MGCFPETTIDSSLVTNIAFRFVGFPLLIVTISLAATQADGYGSPDACWLDVPSGLIWAFIAPAIVIILVSENRFTLYMFVFSINPLAFKNEYCSLIGCTSYYLFCCGN